MKGQTTSLAPSEVLPTASESTTLSPAEFARQAREDDVRENRTRKIVESGGVTGKDVGLYVSIWKHPWPYKGASTNLSANPVHFRRSVTLLPGKTVIRLEEGDAWPAYEDGGVKRRLPLRRLEGDELAAAVPVEVLVLCARAEAPAIDAKKLLATTAAETESRRRLVEQRRREIEQAEAEAEEAARIQASADRHREAEEARFLAWVDGCGYALEAMRATAAALNG